MDYLCQELNIPRKQIAETTEKNRFIVLSHKYFIKNLIKNKKLSNFPVYPHAIDEWPQQKDLGSNWEKIYIVVRVEKTIFIYIFCQLIDELFFSFSLLLSFFRLTKSSIKK